MPAYKLAYYREHRAEILAQQSTYRARNRDRIRSYGAEYATKHKFDLIQKRASLKMEALNAYGGPKCACCGETLFDGLSIDHIAGDGADYRRAGGRQGTGMYQWMKKNGYPPGFQVLCMTCNKAKGQDDHCPHEDLHIAWG